MFNPKTHSKAGLIRLSSRTYRMALSASLLLAAVVPALAADYFVVVPVKGRVADPYANISVSLASYVLPDGKVGEPYSFDFKPLLSVIGDPEFSAGAATWELSQGAFPNGVTLNASTGLVSGTPLDAGQVSFSAKTTYKTKTAGQAYSFNVAPAGPTDPYWNNVVLLASPSATGYLDSSKYAATLAAGSGVSISSLGKFPGTYSMQFTGSSTGISVPFDASKFELTNLSKVWTVEAWVYLQGAPSNIGIYRLDVAGNSASVSGWEAAITANGNMDVVYPGYAGVGGAVAQLQAGRWYHLVWQRNNNTHVFGVDGVVKSVKTYSGGKAANSFFRIGSNYNNSVGITYNLQEVRITNGVARYPEVQGETYSVPNDKFPRK